MGEVVLIVDLMAYLGGGFLMVCFVPQIVKTWRSKKAEELSLWMTVLTIMSALFYEIYAIMLDLLPVIIMNGAFLLLACIQLVLKLVFDFRAPSDAYHLSRLSL